jgi:DNA replication protein DnaC
VGEKRLPGLLHLGGGHGLQPPVRTPRRQRSLQLRTYLKPSVLVIDELGYLPLDQSSANWIFQVVSRRYEKNSPIVLTSNRGFSDWSQVVATAIVDRLIDNAIVINIHGRSYRMRAHQDSTNGKNGR